MTDILMHIVAIITFATIILYITLAYNTEKDNDGH